MTTDRQPLDLDAIQARAARLYERTASIDPNAHPDFGQLTDSDVPALVAEIRRLRERLAVAETDSNRWVGVRNLIEKAIDKGWSSVATSDLEDALGPQPLACGLCFEEQGEEIHPHPECPIEYSGPRDAT